MDFINVKEVFFNGRKHLKVFYNGEIIWSKMQAEYSKDFRNLKENEEFEGVYDNRKNAFVV